MNKLLPKHDKLLHFLSGFWIYVIASIAFTPFIGLVSASIIGAGKELVYDSLMGKGKAELLDFVWTVEGALMYGIILYFL